MGCLLRVAAPIRVKVSCWRTRGGVPYYSAVRERNHRLPAPYMALARDARDRNLTVLASARPHLLEVWYGAALRVARTRGREINRASVEREAHGRYVP